MLFNITQNMRFLPTGQGASVHVAEGRLHFGEGDLVISQNLDMILTDFSGFEKHRGHFTGRAENIDIRALQREHQRASSGAYSSRPISDHDSERQARFALNGDVRTLRSTTCMIKGPTQSYLFRPDTTCIVRAAEVWTFERSLPN